MLVAARGLKVTLELDPAALLGERAVDGEPRTVLKISANGRTVKADIATRSLRKALAAIQEHGTDGVGIIVQGRLEADDSIASAGLAAMPKTPKPVAQAA